MQRSNRLSAFLDLADIVTTYLNDVFELKAMQDENDNILVKLPTI